MKNWQNLKTSYYTALALQRYYCSNKLLCFYLDSMLPRVFQVLHIHQIYNSPNLCNFPRGKLEILQNSLRTLIHANVLKIFTWGIKPVEKYAHLLLY